MTIKDKFDSMALMPTKEYLRKKLVFMLWARKERYTYKQIGDLLGISKENVYVSLKRKRVRKVDNI